MDMRQQAGSDVQEGGVLDIDKILYEGFSSGLHTTSGALMTYGFELQHGWLLPFRSTTRRPYHYCSGSLGQQDRWNVQK